jgi:serine/threonine-protein kinase
MPGIGHNRNTMMDWAAGIQLGPYVLLFPIGAGGMGEVWKARDTRLGRLVAMKRLTGQHSARFEQEARALAALNHPHICQIYDVGPDYLVLEYIEGKPLPSPLAPEKAVQLAIQIASALEEAHGRGILHRDLKPGNILVTEKGAAKLLDFGLAKLIRDSLGADITRTLEGAVVGTVAYMAPEQAEGKPLDARSDVFSFGAVLYEALSGQRAFPGTSTLQVLNAVLRDDPPSLQAPPDLARIVTRCLRKTPEDRFQTAADLRTALEQIVAKRAEKVPSIAVLPFANMSTDKENEYFSDGLSEEIINALTKVPGLRVIARTSAFRFRGEQDLRRVGEALQVGTVLEGSVRRAGNRLRITAQLIDVADDSHIWSERYDREMADVFAIQDEISAAIVDRFKVSLGGHPAAKHPTPKLAAYEAVLEGRHHWYRFTAADLARALECFERAVAIDPGYAEAHVGLAHYYVQLAGLSLAEPRKVLPKAKAAAERAMEVDPALAHAHSALAQAVLWSEHAWPEAERHLRRALALAPASVLVHSAYGALYLRPLGRLQEALAEIDCALEQDPLSPLFRTEKALTLLYRKRYDEAAESCRRALDIDSNFLMALESLVLVRAYQQRFEEALALANQAVQTHGRWSRPLTLLGIAYAVAGHTGDAHRVLEELLELGSRGYVPAGRVAAIYAALGEKDAAFEWAEKAVEQRDPTILSIQSSPIFDPLRSGPRYAALLRQMNLA